MRFSLIICTYKRPEPLLALLASVARQSLYPDEILIVDGSPDDATARMLQRNPFPALRYLLVDASDRGLTRQRNYGIANVDASSQVICFLDDDTELESGYFENLLNTYVVHPDALGAGGYIINEAESVFVGDNYVPRIDEYYFDGWKRKDGSRFILRKRLGLDSNLSPGFMPEFAHGRSVGFLPPSGKIYQTEQLMGGVSSFRREVFDTMKFSTYFQGYGLYEDADFTLRVSQRGPLYVNTAARLSHYHDHSGRPDLYAYGRMVVRNGWFVWRVRHPRPSLDSILKWHAITLLLTIVRMCNVLTTSKRKAAFRESSGRLTGWFSLFFNPPKSD